MDNTHTRRDFVKLLGLTLGATQIPKFVMSSENEFYTVNIGTYANPKNIEDLTKRLGVLRFPVDYKFMEKDGVFLTRVGAGPYDNLDDVAFNAHALQKILDQDLWIVKYTKVGDSWAWEHVGEVHTQRDIEDILTKYSEIEEPAKAVPKSAEVFSLEPKVAKQRVGDIDEIIDKWVGHYQQENPHLRAEHIYALIDIESNWDQNAIGYKLRKDKKRDIYVRVKDKDGNYIPTAVGLMQVAFSNFEHYCPVDLPNKEISTLQDLEINIASGIRIFSDCLKQSNGDLQGAYICYNGGPSRLRNWKKGRPIPAETVDHSKKGIKAAADYHERFSN